MQYQFSPRLVFVSCALLATAGCATYGGQPRRDVYFEVPCGAAGAFRAELPPGKPGGIPGPAEPAAAAPQSQSSEAQAPPAANAASGRESICLARADYLPRGYRGSAYRYYGNNWWPYSGYGYGYGGFGYGFGFGGHVGGGHRGGGHGGGGHGGGGHGGGHGGGGHGGGGHH